MRVLVTGANRGIGRGLCAAYAARGAEVTGTARGAAAGNGAGHGAGQGAAGHGAAGLLPLDLADPASVRGLAAAFGPAPLDLLVCNAGVYIDRGEDLALGYPADAWAETFAVNVTGVFLTVQAMLPALRAARGKVAIIASAMGSDARAPGGSYIYRAAKAAALNLGRNLATDLAAEGIAVGIYHPGWVRTELGGTAAEIDVAESVAGLVARFDALSAATTGVFEDYRGSPVPF